MAKKNLTDRTLKSLKPAMPGKRYDLGDVREQGLLVRVTERGVRTFMLSARFPNAKWSTRRALGIYPDMSLERARAKARAWREMIDNGVDPGQAEVEARIEAKRRQANSFSAVAEAFIGHMKRQGQRKADEVEQDLRREFIGRWGVRPVTTITSADVREVIEAKVEQGRNAQAHNLLGTIRRLFNWAIGRDAYGLELSPCNKLKPRGMIGERAVRDRVLSDPELQAFWRATATLGYPYGPLFRLLLLTIQRKGEIAEVVRSELDLTSRLTKLKDVRTGKDVQSQNGLVLEIPGARMKMKYAHLVPLSPMAVDLFAALPAFSKGEHLFSTTFGVKPVNGFAKAKVRLDQLMVAELKAMAAERGESPTRVELKPWVIHDLRRTGRTRLSRLRVPHEWMERTIAHVKKGLDKNYDHHDFLQEKRETLELWAVELRAIVQPAPSNVVALQAVRA